MGPDGGTEKSLTGYQSLRTVPPQSPHGTIQMDNPKPPRATRSKSTNPEGKPATPARKRAPKLQIVREKDPSKAVELRKPPEALLMRNVSPATNFTFLQRKLYNTLLQFAQQRPHDEMVHEIPIKVVEEHVGHTTSNSRDYLKEVLYGMVDLKVEFDFRGEGKKNTSWGVATLIAEAYILEDNETVRYSFPADMKRRLLDPEIFNLIDLRMQYQFSSFSALALHEIVSRYSTSPHGETYRAHWQQWSVLLSGSPEPHAEFRDFNKLLGRAVDQVNNVEKRFQITTMVTKNNRKMDKLWFKIDQLIQPGLDLLAPPGTVGKELVNRLKTLSLSAKDIEELRLAWDEEYLLAQADYTDGQIKKEGSKVASPAAYFKAAVEKNYAKAPTQAKAPEPSKPSEKKETAPKAPKATTKSAAPAKAAQTDQMADLLEQWSSAQRAAIGEEIDNLDDDGKIALVLKYEHMLKQDHVAFGQYRTKGATKTVMAYVRNFIFDERFPETPTSDVLLQFLLAGSKI